MAVDAFDVHEAQKESATRDDSGAPQRHKTRSGMMLPTCIDVVSQKPLPQLLWQP
ncbi:hypothetical protein ACFVYR_31980 [Streptomyces sp. NPDC058284]|uniref:hypothetical protein n=1 Tax=unclassified Streptomyces TaxID=2593676 RepID=UPI00364D0804